LVKPDNTKAKTILSKVKSVVKTVNDSSEKVQEKIDAVQNAAAAKLAEVTKIQAIADLFQVDESFSVSFDALKVCYNNQKNDPNFANMQSRLQQAFKPYYGFEFTASVDVNLLGGAGTDHTLGIAVGLDVDQITAFTNFIKGVNTAKAAAELATDETFLNTIKQFN